MFNAVLLADSGGGIIAGFGIFGLLISLVIFAFWLWMLVDCLTSSMESGEKILWFLVIFFLPLIGSLIYYFVKRGGRTAIV